MNRRIPCKILDRRVDVPEHPQRIVSLVSSATETIFELGAGERVAGVSAYCHRYVDTSRAQVAGDYLRVDEETLRRLRPDLVLATTGVQLGLARRLAAAGYPVFVLPVPTSFYGILDNIRQTGGLIGELEAAHALTRRLETETAELRAATTTTTTATTTTTTKGGGRPPRVLADLWFGRYERFAGGMTFIHDLIGLAGGENIFATRPEAYLKPDLEEARTARPEAVIVFSEEDDHPVDLPTLVRERGWETLRVIESSIRRGRIVIHDGPSILETARWLAAELRQGCHALRPPPPGPTANRREQTRNK
ncbi:MAG: helical backbone metal receptor [Opitutaceae bacterium]|jgi:ABC-type Fe3+-hydroxamate transport system substrate-binding protein|nr:helical backbone metal receptor [Opitutaceae bacterium]